MDDSTLNGNGNGTRAGGPPDDEPEVAPPTGNGSSASEELESETTESSETGPVETPEPEPNGAQQSDEPAAVDVPEPAPAPEPEPQPEPEPEPDAQHEPAPIDASEPEPEPEVAPIEAPEAEQDESPAITLEALLAAVQSDGGGDGPGTAEAAPMTEAPAPAIEAPAPAVAAVAIQEAPATSAVAVEAPPVPGEAVPEGEGQAEEEEPLPEWIPGDWFVVHTYSGYENKVKTSLEMRVHSMNMEEKIFEIVVPMEDVMEVKGGKKQLVQRKVFPGYLLVRMDLDDDSWYVVRNTPGVTGFVGSGTKPIPLSAKEVDQILKRKGVEEKPKPKLEFSVTDAVRVVVGPFANFQGVISEIDTDRSKLKVLVNIFGRETPVELGFDQVQKI